MCVVALLFNARSFPADFHAELFGGGIDEVSYAVLHASGNNEVFRFFLLEHHPLHFDVVFGVAPVALGIQVAEEHAVLQAELDARQGAGDLAGDEGFATNGTFVVEQDAVAGVEAVGFAVVDNDPIAVHLGYGIRTARVEGGGFLLGDFLYQAVELAGAGLVEACFLFQTEDANGFEQAQHTQGVGVGGVFGLFEADGDVALGGEVVYLVGLNLLDDADEAGAIGHVTMVEEEAYFFLVAVFVEMVDAVGVEKAGAALDAVDDVAFVEEEFGEVGAVLTGDASDEGDFGLGGHGVLFPSNTE